MTGRFLPCLAALAAILAVTVGGANSQTVRARTIGPAIDEILTAFQTHSLVGMHNDEGGDNHDLAQQQDFYAALVRDPRFARNVGNVVVEFGDAIHQNLIDRYVNGEDVPYTELRKVWTDTVGWTPPPFNLGYVNLFAQIRATNLSLPASQRIRVWLGEPPVDWSKVKKPEDVVPSGENIMSLRDNYVAGLIEREIFSRGRKALVIYGNFHFSTDPAVLNQIPGYSSMGAQIERKHPGAIFNVETYTGLANRTCNAEFERNKAKLATPVLVTEAGGNISSDPSFRRRCVLIEAAKIDALLYLGPASSLTSSPLMPDAYLDGAYMKELQRRWKIMGMQATPSDLFITVDKNGVSPKPFVTHGDIDSRVVSLSERAKTNKASPEAEAALRRIIAGLRKGKPPYDELAPDLADNIRKRLINMQRMMNGWGALKSFTFKGVAPDGTDIYQVEFENTKILWQISPPIDDKIFLLNFRPS